MEMGYCMILTKDLLSMDELEELLSNDVAFELFFNSLERVQNMKTVQEELRNGNVNLASKSYEWAWIRNFIKEYA